jgi:hypothetical protein
VRPRSLVTFRAIRTLTEPLEDIIVHIRICPFWDLVLMKGSTELHVRSLGGALATSGRRCSGGSNTESLGQDGGDELQ